MRTKQAHVWAGVDLNTDQKGRLRRSTNNLAEGPTYRLWETGLSHLSVETGGSCGIKRSKRPALMAQEEVPVQKSARRKREADLDGGKRTKTLRPYRNILRRGLEGPKKDV